jgi:prolyl-tRNA synthetase
MTMVHGDNVGLVLPPRVAPIQVVLIPIFKKDADNKALEAKIREIQIELNRRGLRAQVDSRDYVRPGQKYNQWEMKGVPLRVELGIPLQHFFTSCVSYLFFDIHCDCSEFRSE